MTAQAVIDAIAPISDKAHPGHNARTASLLDLAGMSAKGDRLVVFETNSLNAALPLSLTEHGIAILSTPLEECKVHGVITGLVVLALFDSFAVVSRLNLAEAILISQLSPILMALDGAVFLSERPTKRRIWGLIFGSAGVITIVWPELSGLAQEGTRLRTNP